jgi:hypothetical protein
VQRKHGTDLGIDGVLLLDDSLQFLLHGQAWFAHPAQEQRGKKDRKWIQNGGALMHFVYVLSSVFRYILQGYIL